MSGWLSVIKFEDFIVPFCPDYISVPPVSTFLIAFDFYPIYLSVGLWLASLIRHEWYLFFTSLFLFADFGVNTALQYIVRQAGQYPGCGMTYEMPSFASEQICVFVVLSYGLVGVWRIRVPSMKVFVLQVVLYAVLVARVYLGINTRAQLFWGAFTGTLEGVLYLLLLHFLVMPYRKDLLNSRVFHLMGVEDSLFGSEEPRGASECDAMQRALG